MEEEILGALVCPGLLVAGGLPLLLKYASHQLQLMNKELSQRLLHNHPTCIAINEYMKNEERKTHENSEGNCTNLPQLPDEFKEWRKIFEDWQNEGRHIRRRRLLRQFALRSTESKARAGYERNALASQGSIISGPLRIRIIPATGSHKVS